MDNNIFVSSFRKVVGFCSTIISKAKLALLKNRKLVFKSGVVLLGFFLIYILFLYFTRPKELPVYTAPENAEYIDIIPDSIIRDTNITFNLPEKLSSNSLPITVALEPSIESDITISGGRVEIKPKQPLPKNAELAVTISQGETLYVDYTISEERPALYKIYPASGQTLDPMGQISLLFDKQATSLDSVKNLTSLENTPLLSPDVSGVWEWKGSDTLMFRPKDGLATSTKYTMTIDSLPLGEGGSLLNYDPVFKTTEFIVSPIVLESKTVPVSVTDPFVLDYSQFVDSVKTSPEVSVINTTTNTAVPVLISVVKDKISILPEKNNAGVSAWNFGDSYKVTINNVYPIVGNISINVADITDINFNSLVSSTSATYKKANIGIDENAEGYKNHFFHPDGELHVFTTEEVDKKYLRIAESHIKSVSYGECEYNCRTKHASDLKHLIFTFKKDKIKLGQVEYSITLSNIRNSKGVLLTQTPQVINLTSPKKLKFFEAITPIEKVSKNDNRPIRRAYSNSSVTLCTSLPILTPKDKFKTWGNYLTFTGGPSTLRGWYDSTYIYPEYKKEGYNYNCPVNTFLTIIDVGLNPNTDYKMNIQITDIFGTVVPAEFNFNSGEIAKEETNISALQPSTVITQSNDTQLAYSVKNILTLPVKICQMSPEEYILSRSYGTRMEPKCTKTYNASVSGADRYWKTKLVGVNVSEIAKQKYGFYKVTVGNDKMSVQSWIQISDISVIEKSSPQRTIVFINNSKTLTPVSGAKIQSGEVKSNKSNSYMGNENQNDKKLKFTLENKLTLAKTNTEGVSLNKSIEHNYMIVSSDDDSTVLMSDTDTLKYKGYDSSSIRSYVYTDRPIYKPGDLIHWKVISRQKSSGKLSIPTDHTMRVVLVSENGNEISTTEAKLDENGSINGEFTLPADARLGGYYLQAEGGSAYIQTERYVKSPFKVTASATKKMYYANERGLIDIEAERFEGLPLSGANVEVYTVSQNDVYDCYEYEEDCSYGDRFEQKKTETIPESGKLSLPVRFNDLFKPEDFSSNERIMNSVVTVSDKNGRSVSSKLSYLVRRSPNDIFIKNSMYYGAVNQPITTNLVLKTESEQAVSNAEITFTIDRITWDYIERQEQDGNYYKKWSQIVTAVSTEKVTTDQNGNAAVSWVPKENGEYRLRAKDATDSRAEEIFYVSGSGSYVSEPNNDNGLTLTVPKKEVNVGFNAPIIMKTQYPSGLALITVEQADLIKYEIVPFSSNIFTYTLPIVESYIPNIFIAVTIIDAKGNVAFAESTINVNTETKKLNVSVSHNKKNYLPGENAEVTVHVKDQAGKPVQGADISVSVVDQSILALYGNAPKQLVEFFYDYYGNLVSTLSNLVNRLHTIDIALGNGAKGGDGGDNLSRKKRGVFKDTAFWVGSSLTNEKGEAVVTFAFPDNLTQWQTEVVAQTKDGLFGANRGITQTSKLLSVEPIQPQFLSYGDIFELPIQVFNKTKQTQSTKIKVTSRELFEGGSFMAGISVPPMSTRTYYVPMSVPENLDSKTASVDIAVESKDLYDEVSYSFPIRPATIIEYVANGSYTYNSSAVNRLKQLSVKPGEGTITIRTGATSGEYIKKGLESLARYPYGCVEQKSSQAATLAFIDKLSKNYPIFPNYKGTVYNGKYDVAVTDALKETITNVESSIHENGSFSFYENMPDDFELTLAVLESLVTIRNSKTVPVSDKVIASASRYALDYATDQLTNINISSEYKADALIRSIYMAQFAGEQKDKISSLLPNINSYLEDKALVRSLSSDSVALALLINDQNKISRNTRVALEDEISSRISIDGRGAYIPQGNTTYNFDSDISATTYYLRHLMNQGKMNDPIVYKILSWLVKAQNNQGMFGSTRDTIRTVSTLVDLLEKSPGSKMSSEISVFLGAKLIDTKKLDSSTIFEPLITKISDSQIDPNKVNKITTERKLTLFSKYLPLFTDIVYGYTIPAKTAPALDRGFNVTREYVGKTPAKDGTISVKQGEVVRVRIQVENKKESQLVGLDDSIPAGFEIINENLNTESTQEYEDKQDKDLESNDQDYKNKIWKIYPSHTESQTDRRFIFIDSLSPGKHVYEYFVRARTPGTFTTYPAVVSELYSPETFGRSTGVTVKITR